jgi:hypothetical protein
MNRKVSRIFARPDTLPATPPDMGMGMWEKENAPHAPVKDQNEGGIEPIGIQSGDDADANAGDPREAVERASEDPDSAQPPTVAVDSFGDEGDEGDEDYTEDDVDGKYADSDNPPLSDTPSPTPAHQPARISAGVSFTPEDHEAMVRFVSGLNRKPVKADWVTFWSLVRDHYWA